MGPTFQSVLRVVAAAMFILHGTMKLFAWPAAITPDGSTVALMSQLGLAGVLDLRRRPGAAEPGREAEAGVSAPS